MTGAIVVWTATVLSWTVGMPDWASVTDELLEWSRQQLPSDEAAVKIRVGAAAYATLVAVLAGEKLAALAGEPDAVSRGLLVLTGLPLYVEEEFPPNMYAVIDGRGYAVMAGILTGRRSPDVAAG